MIWVFRYRPNVIWCPFLLHQLGSILNVVIHWTHYLADGPLLSCLLLLRVTISLNGFVIASSHIRGLDNRNINVLVFSKLNVFEGNSILLHICKSTPNSHLLLLVTYVLQGLCNVGKWLPVWCFAIHLMRFFFGVILIHSYCLRSNSEVVPCEAVLFTLKLLKDGVMVGSYQHFVLQGILWVGWHFLLPNLSHCIFILSLLFSGKFILIGDLDLSKISRWINVGTWLWAFLPLNSFIGTLSAWPFYCWRLHVFN